jgi:predicted MPP superfamily phosphohydrolase
LGFVLFISTFMTLYSAMHFYAFMKAKNALALNAGSAGGLIFFMLIMVFSPAMVHVFEDLGFEKIAKVLAHVGYTWMGLLFLFFCSSLFVDVLRLAAWLTRIVFNLDIFRTALTSPHAFFAALIVAVLVTIYGFSEALNIQTEHCIVKTSKLTEQDGPVRIVQITDVHLGLMVREIRLGRILRKVREASPDIFVSTGDLVDGQIDHLDELANMLGEIRPRLGKFAVTGNHEFYAGITRSLEFTQKAGFRVLRGEAQTVGRLITIAGVDDPAGRGFGKAAGSPEGRILSGLPDNRFAVLLKHRPSVSQQDHFDLQVSGHAHKGQVFPFTLFVRLFFPMISGLYDLPNGSMLYVSRGSGTWGPPIRVLAPPEVTIIDIVPEKTS